MKYLAWDIGIKNLAYSIIDFDIKTKQKTIQDWGIVNLMTEVGKTTTKKPSLICSSTNQKGKPCTKKATFLFIDDPDKGLCGAHRNTNKYKKDKFFELSKKPTCCYEIADKISKENKDKAKKNNTEIKKTTHLCGKKSIYCRHDNLLKSYCNQHYKAVHKKDPFKTYEIKITKKESCKSQSILTLSKRLFQHLDNLQDKLINVDVIIIENQPVLKNPTMKTIQIMLYSYFVMNGILKEKVKDIHFFSASKKLEAYNDVDDKYFNTVKHLSNQYQINKKLAILFTKEMIKNSKWEKFFLDNDKKDDLADAYLTGCYFINREHKLKP